MSVLLQVMTLFLLMLCGFFAAKRHMLDDHSLRGLNTLVLHFAQPALILHRLQTPASPELLADLAWVFLLTCVTIGLAGIVSFRLFFREEASRRAVLTNLAMVSNCGFMGFPIIIATLGEDALIYAVIFLAAFNLMCWTQGACYFGGRSAIQPQRLLRNPSIWGILIGMLFFLTGFKLPGFMDDALSMLGSTTTPLTMFVIGARLTSLTRAHLQDRKLLLACGLRLLVFPLLILLLRLTPLSPVVVNTLYVCTAMPCAAMTAMQAELFGSDGALASRGVALSTGLSMVTVPLLLMLI